jgi:ribulose-phosphate 3-epimerase
MQQIKTLGNTSVVAINPGRSATVLEEIKPDLDQLLVMTVNPGFG